MVVRAFHIDRGLSGRETCDRYSKRRARYVIEAALHEKFNGRRIASVFAANANLEFRSRGASAFHGHAHELADTVTIDDLEWIIF